MSGLTENGLTSVRLFVCRNLLINTPAGLFNPCYIAVHGNTQTNPRAFVSAWLDT